MCNIAERPNNASKHILELANMKEMFSVSVPTCSKTITHSQVASLKTPLTSLLVSEICKSANSGNDLDISVP